MRDFIVTLNAAKHSSGSFGKTMDMIQFNNAVNNIEVEDICDSGFHFTWTKSLRNPHCNILKKLDRILINDSFLKSYQASCGDFLRYMVFDHIPSVLYIKNSFSKRASSFKFSNFIADKEKFIRIVKQEWEEDEEDPFMTRYVTDKEIKEAMFDIDGDKSSRPDSFSSIFFIKAWDIVGNEVSTPTKVYEFRPIACHGGMDYEVSELLVSICLNGEMHGFFKGGRGLRQGRTQLIASVLSSMQMYWASIFLLPLTVINDLEKLFKRFLWNAGDSTKGKPRVAWKVICKPKDQGGLGIRSLKRWKEVLIIKQFWKIIENKDSLWAKWVNVVRDEIKEHVLFELGNERKTCVWGKDGPHSKTISKRDIYDARLQDVASVADMINNGRWMWPDGWTNKYPILAALKKNAKLTDYDDKVMYITNEDKNSQLFYKTCMEGSKNKWS
ncbi:hypothetical protein Tco_0943354 [Tanacetum coccineum]